MNKVDMSVWLCTNPLRSGQSQAFPQRFISQLNKYYPLGGKRVLWMFGGGVKNNPDYIKLDRHDDTNDIREETESTYCCSFDEIPASVNGTYDMVIADPPYNALYAKEWEKDLPKPKHIIREAERLLKPNGILILFHIIVTPTYRKSYGFERIGLHPVLCGLGNAIRVVNVLQKSNPKESK